MNNGINGDQNYKNRYDSEFKKDSRELKEPLTIDKAQFLVDDYINLLGNPDLKSGKIIDNGNEFEAEIITKEGSLFDKIIIIKQSGEIKSKY